MLHFLKTFFRTFIWITGGSIALGLLVFCIYLLTLTMQSMFGNVGMVITPLSIGAVIVSVVVATTDTLSRNN